MAHQSFEGGETKKRSTASFRNKCDFDKPRNPRYNTNHLQIARVFKIILLIVDIFLVTYSWNYQKTVGFEPIQVFFAYYSCWGALIAVASLIFSILATHFEGWFSIAYITTEISFSVNTTIMLIFWLILWPVMSSLGMLDDSEVRAYQAAVHFFPMVTTVTELAFTDMALEKGHWWIQVLVMCPFYMLANYWGSQNIALLVK